MTGECTTIAGDSKRGLGVSSLCRRCGRTSQTGQGSGSASRNSSASSRGNRYRKCLHVSIQTMERGCMAMLTRQGYNRVNCSCLTIRLRLQGIHRNSFRSGLCTLQVGVEIANLHVSASISHASAEHRRSRRRCAPSHPVTGSISMDECRSHSQGQIPAQSLFRMLQPEKRRRFKIRPVSPAILP